MKLKVYESQANKLGRAAKQFFLLIITAATLQACSEDIRDNSPALEGLRNGSRWRAAGMTATLGTGGDLTISGGNQFETLELHTPSTTPQEYVLGNSTSRTAKFTIIGDGSEKVFRTAIAIGDGNITIEEYDEVKKTISGTFRFNAVDTEAVDSANPTAAETLNFIEGVFYEVPVRAGL